MHNYHGAVRRDPLITDREHPAVCCGGPREHRLKQRLQVPGGWESPRKPLHHIELVVTSVAGSKPLAREPPEAHDFADGKLYGDAC